jgi:hypothetical protein
LALNNRAKLAGAVTTFLGTCLTAGVLMPIVKLILSQLGWYALGRAVSKILMLILLPELEAADLIASFTAWSVQLVAAAQTVQSDCGQQVELPRRR